MPKELKQQQNLFIKKSLNRHLGVGGPSTSDHSENSRTSTPTVSEDESGTKSSRGTEPGASRGTESGVSRGAESGTSRGAESGDAEQRQAPASKPPADAAADERAARMRAEHFQQALNDSANEAETSSISNSSDGRDSRAGDHKTSKRPIKNKRDHAGRGGYSHRGGYRGNKYDRRDSGRMGHGHGHFPRGPRMNMIPFQHAHRPPPPMHVLEQLSQSPRDSAFIPSPRRTPRHSESSSCGSPRLFPGSGQTPPQSPRGHFYDSPIQSPLRHHISPYNSPPRHPASPIPRMMHPAEHLIQPHPAMMARHHPMPGSIPIPMPPQPDVGAFSGTPPPQFHPMNNPHMRPLTPEQHQVHMMAAMQQRAAEQAQQQQQQHFEQQQMAHQMKMKQNQESMHQMLAQMTKGGQITMTPDQLANFVQTWSMVQGANMMPGGQGMVPPPWMPQGAPQPEAMINPVPQPAPDMPPQMMQQVQMGQSVHPMFLQQQQLHGLVPSQTPPPAHLAGQPIPGQSLSSQQLPGQPINQPIPSQSLSGQPVPGPMHGGIPVQHFMQSQQIMIPRPIHPEMGNTSNITPPQNRNLPVLDPAHGMPPPQFGLHMPGPPVPATQPPLMPASEVAVPSTGLQLEDPPSSVIQTTTAVPAPENGSVTSQESYQNSALTVSKSADVQVVSSSSEAAPPAPKPPTAPVTPVKQPTKTPGLIRLPQDHQLPTEEDLLKSPDASGTPVNMKKNYWQNRQKSTDSVEKSAPPKSPPPKEEQEVKAAEPPPPVPVVVPEKVKPEPTSLPEPAEPVVKPAPEKPVETPKKKSEKPKTKGFNLSDLGDLVTKTVTHNNNIPKTDISAAVNTGNVEVVLNQGYRRTHSPCQARAVDTRDREKSDTWRPLNKPKLEPEPEAGGSWRVQDNPAGASNINVLEDDPERTRALQEAEAKALSTGHQIQYAIEKLQKQSRNKTVSESSSKGPKEEVAGEEAWYDEEDEDRIDCFDLTI